MAHATETDRSVGVFEAEDLSYRYAGAESASLRDVAVSIRPGEFVVLAGRSGSGKTSLLKSGCGLIPHFHGGEIKGSVRVAGRDTREFGPGELADVVGYVAQDPETQIISTTVAAELDLPLRFRGDHPAERARAVEEVALALGIPHLLDRSVMTLSGGEMQRVALAVALVTRPLLILLDEPTSQLDPVAGDELIWLLRRLNEEWGVAVLLAEHRLERCLPAADRVLAMESGSIAFDGSARDFLLHANRHDVALATPAARMFSMAGIRPMPVGVRDARDILADRGLARSLKAGGESFGPGPVEAGPESTGDALTARRLWVELDPGEGPVDVIRGLDLALNRGETVALMGRNGAGKSTLLRSAAGLVKPAKGKITTPGGTALLTQNPGDYLVRDRVGDELSGPEAEAALDAVSLAVNPEADPRDLSGGERQRLALAMALAGQMEGGSLPGLVALDEPTRGMDRSLKDGLGRLAKNLATRGAAVLIATHDVEFAAEFADRVVLLGDGELIADADTATILSGGWYFATEVARVIDRPGLIRVDDGAAILRQLDLAGGDVR